ncbi:MAG: hypothetical protein QOK41_1930 [Sphingomonadales bacterium]|nr:hypothetical protein [Sphingomonadales bacterium]
MFDRQALGDLAFAVLLALPMATLARPQPVVHKAAAAPAVITVASADHSPGNGRISLLG